MNTVSATVVILTGSSGGTSSTPSNYVTSGGVLVTSGGVQVTSGS